MKIFGIFLYRIAENTDEMIVMVMKNVLPHDKKMARVYDLKGSTYNRFVRLLIAAVHSTILFYMLSNLLTFAFAYFMTPGYGRRKKKTHTHVAGQRSNWIL